MHTALTRATVPTDAGRRPANKDAATNRRSNCRRPALTQPRATLLAPASCLATGASGRPGRHTVTQPQHKSVNLIHKRPSCRAVCRTRTQPRKTMAEPPQPPCNGHAACRTQHAVHRVAVRRRLTARRRRPRPAPGWSRGRRSRRGSPPGRRRGSPANQGEDSKSIIRQCNNSQHG